MIVYFVTLSDSEGSRFFAPLRMTGAVAKRPPMKAIEVSRSLDESKEYIAKGNAVQASEKLYKAVEECIKILAEQHKLPEYSEAKEDGRWKNYLLAQAAGKLAYNLRRKEIEDAWARAFNIHVWGFHEGKFDVEDIKPDVPYVEWLIDYVKEKEGEFKKS